MMRSGVIRPGEHVTGHMRLEFYDDDLVVEFDSRAWDTGGWLRLRYAIVDYWTSENVEIDDTRIPPPVSCRTLCDNAQSHRLRSSVSLLGGTPPHS